MDYKWIVVLSLFALPVFAEEITLTCTDPTQNEDGSPLTDLEFIRFYVSDTDGGPYVQVAEETVCSTILELGEGTYYFVARAVNTSGVESQNSNQATRIVGASPPAPPTGLVADVDQVAYAIQQFTDGLVVYPVALVDDTTDCDPFTKVSTAAHPTGLSLIPRDAVTFAPGADAYTVYAECSEI